LNIGLLIFNADPARGGAERYTADLAAALARRGHQVDLLTARWGSEEIPGVHQVTLGAKAATRAGAYDRFLDSLDAHLAKNTYDIVHAMLPVRRCDVYHPHAGMARASYEANFINRLNRKRRRYAQVEQNLLTGQHRPIVLCLSDYVKASILKCYPSIGDRLEKLFNAVDLEKFDPGKYALAGKGVREKLGIGSDQIVGLMIAQHFEQKGLPQAIEAIARIEKTRRPILIVLGKDDPSRCKAMAKQAGVAEQIIFAGTTDRPGDFYAAADFFVLPTSHDSCSLVVLESLAMGVPVISTVFNGACEIMKDGREGFVLSDPKDVKALSGAMESMLEENLRGSMRDRARSLREVLTFQTHLSRLEQIYQSIKK
jgi:UDP-glucose:(heptosyl)LPS alpha-1,3-glucosyltransferase